MKCKRCGSDKLEQATEIDRLRKEKEQAERERDEWRENYQVMLDANLQNIERAIRAEACERGQAEKKEER